MRDLFNQHPFFAPEPEPGSGGGAAAPEIKVEDAIAALDGNEDYVVMSAAEFKKKKTDISRQEATNHVGKTHGIYDTLFKELSGLEKEDDEKTVDYGKRVVKHIEEKAQGEPNEQINLLKEQLDTTKEKYVELQSSVDEINSEHENELLKRDINSEFQTGLFNVMPKLGYDNDNEKELALIGFEKKFFNTYDIKIEDGEKQVFDKSTGKVLTDKALKDMAPVQVVQEFAQSMLKFSNSASKGGAGTKSPSNNGMPALTTIEELDAYLLTKLGKSGGKAWAAERTKMRKELAL